MVVSYAVGVVQAGRQTGTSQFYVMVTWLCVLVSCVSRSLSMFVFVIITCVTGRGRGGHAC